MSAFASLCFLRRQNRSASGTVQGEMSMQRRTEKIRQLPREPLAVQSASFSLSLPQREFPAAALSSAVSRAFHASSAHFTRAGNFDTPPKERSEPSDLSSSAPSDVPMPTSRNFPPSCSTSSDNFPFPSCVIIEADACEMEHP